MHRAVHVVKQMGLATKFKEQVDSVKDLKIDWEILKGDYSNWKKKNKAKKDCNCNLAVATAKAVLNEAQKAWGKVEAKAEVVGAQLFNSVSVSTSFLISPVSIGTRFSRCRWTLPLGKFSRENFKDMGVAPQLHDSCTTFHLLTVFRHKFGRVVKYYITNTLKKPS